jgi:hypothetical protein
MIKIRAIRPSSELSCSATSINSTQRPPSDSSDWHKFIRPQRPSPLSSMRVSVRSFHACSKVGVWAGRSAPGLARGDHCRIAIGRLLDGQRKLLVLGAFARRVASTGSPRSTASAMTCGVTDDGVAVNTKSGESSRRHSSREVKAGASNRRGVRTTTAVQGIVPSSRATLRNIRARQPLPISTNVVTRKR